MTAEKNVEAAAAAAAVAEAADADAAAARNEEAPLQTNPPPVFLSNLSILSPRQRKTSNAASTTTPGAAAAATTTGAPEVLSVALPPLRPEEPVASLRGALSEVVGFAHLTRYRLVVERLTERQRQEIRRIQQKTKTTTTKTATTTTTTGGDEGSGNTNGGNNGGKRGKNNKKGNNGNNSNNNNNNGTAAAGKDVECWSPFTLRNAAVTTSPSLRSLEAGGAVVVERKKTENNKAAAADDDNEEEEEEEELVLDEYGDLSILLPLLENNAAAAAAAAVNGTAAAADGTAEEEDPSEESKIMLDASGLAIRVVLEKYDLASVRDHVGRTRQLAEGNAPYVTTLLGDDDAADDADVAADAAAGDDEAKESVKEKEDVVAEDAAAAADKPAESDDKDKAVADVKATAEKEKKEIEAAKEAKKKAIAEALPVFPPNHDMKFETAAKEGDLTNFYYLACGEEGTLIQLANNKGGNKSGAKNNGKKANNNNDWMDNDSEDSSGNENQKENKKQKNGGKNRNNKSKKSKGADNHTNNNKATNGASTTKNANKSSNASNSANDNTAKSFLQVERSLYDLNETVRISTTLRLSGYHPPPAHRRVLGDLAYLEATMPDGSTVHVTAFALGFYVNKSNSSGFDPTPNARLSGACYSHALLDCLLQRSKPLRIAWSSALTAAKLRSELLHETAVAEDANDNGYHSPLAGLFRNVASPFPNNTSGPSAAMGYGMGALMATAPSTFVPRIDSTTVHPSWLVPLPSKKLGDVKGPSRNTWEHDALHSYDAGRAEEELTNTYGMDVRSGGGLRDWNEELQTAREMGVETFGERIERARLVHKVLSDFGEAALAGVKSIFDGYILPMNPNEPARSHVYLHNNIFFSRAVDPGPDTFKIIQGDGAARKSASRDAHNMGVLHRLDIPGLFTLATVLVEYLGMRIVCQSVVPGILHGEKSHTLLYGAVETLSALRCDEEMHKLLESSIGEGCMVATRKIPVHPLTEERMDIIKECRIATPLPGMDMEERREEEVVDVEKTIQVCGPMEMKGILGSDQRKYVLDCTRLTPRDANWVSKSDGGTGFWEDKEENEATLSSSKAAQKKKLLVPSSLKDDEWTACVLRPELVTNYAEMKIGEYLKETKAKSVAGDKKKKKEDSAKDAVVDEKKVEKSNSGEEKEWVNVPEGQEAAKKDDAQVEESKRKEESQHMAKVEEEYIRSLRYNVNVFLPYTRSIEINIDEESHKALKADEEEARSLARHLWDAVIPALTGEVRSSSSGNGHLQLPADGKSLTELIHSRGINCRYLGRLAELAKKEELLDLIAVQKVALENAAAAAASKDGDNAAADKPKISAKAPRFRMPICWLEQLECEMVARAAKHVLDSYMMEQGGAASGSSQPAQTIASFLSALVSTGEESAATTEMRLGKEAQRSDVLDQEDMNALTLFDVGGDEDSSVMRGRDEMWSDIEAEIGRRYRYTLTLYNGSGTSSSPKKDAAESSRALYIPLLRRICQRSGIRLVAKQYAVGKKCVCGSSGGNGSGGLSASYPIAPTDILDILPLVKHAASVPGESFAPTSFNSGNAAVAANGSCAPSLHVLLSDAKTVYEFAHANLSSGNAAVALEYAQEAMAMCQRVLDHSASNAFVAHPQISKCLKLTAVAHYHRDEHDLAIAAATKHLAVSALLGGYDSSEVLNAHLTLADILLGNTTSSSSNATTTSEAKRVADGLKHLRASQFLMEFLGGPNYAGISSSYYRMGSHYYEVGKFEEALRFYELASERRSEDRMFDCLIARNSAGVLARLGQFKVAFDYEKKAYQLYVAFLGEDHDATKACSNTLIQLMKLAVEQEKRSKIQEKERVQVNAADVVADQLLADEEEAANKQKNKKKKQSKKKGKK